MSNGLKTLTNGLLKENPTFVLVLGMCPTLATTTSAINGMSMGLATMFVLVCSNIVISLLKNLIPDKVRIPAFIVVIATFVTIVQLAMQAYLPSIYEVLGLFIPLIVVNCIVLGRIGMGLGFTLALTLLGACREILGSGKIFSIGTFEGFQIFPNNFAALIFVLAPGAFIALAYLMAIMNKLQKK